LLLLFLFLLQLILLPALALFFRFLLLHLFLTLLLLVILLFRFRLFLILDIPLRLIFCRLFWRLILEDLRLLYPDGSLDVLGTLLDLVVLARVSNFRFRFRELLFEDRFVEAGPETVLEIRAWILVRVVRFDGVESPLAAEVVHVVVVLVPEIVVILVPEICRSLVPENGGTLVPENGGTLVPEICGYLAFEVASVSKAAWVLVPEIGRTLVPEILLHLFGDHDRRRHLDVGGLQVPKVLSERGTTAPEILGTFPGFAGASAETEVLGRRFETGTVLAHTFRVVAAW